LKKLRFVAEIESDAEPIDDDDTIYEGGSKKTSK